MLQEKRIDERQHDIVKRVHIIGGKNHGKTTLIVELLRVLTKQGLCVGTIKHTHHHHELDTPGKDSFRHRQAGADVVGICSPTMNAVFWPGRNDGPGLDDDAIDGKYAEYAPMFEHCDLVLVEGDSDTSALKVEVWRSDVGSTPLAQRDETIAAVITDDTVRGSLSTAIWRRSDITTLVQNFLSLRG